MSGAPLHHDLAALSFLLGTWTGEGAGEYPTIEPFSYGEEVRFWHTGKPFLAYQQRTWHLGDGRPLHSETGYWRTAGPGRVEAVLSHPTGIAEVEEGTVDAQHLELATTTVARTSSAKRVDALQRILEVDGDTLTYRVAMAAVGQPLVHHLAATLERTDA